MAEVEAKVNMSLDEIIKMEKLKKVNAKGRRDGFTRSGMRGATRGNMRGGGMRGGRGSSRYMRGNTNMNTRNRNNMNNRRGQWKRFPQNNNYSNNYHNNYNNDQRGGFIQNRFNNGNIKSNLRRSRSSMSLNRLNASNSRNPRGGFNPRRGGRFGMRRSRSRSNINYAKPSYGARPQQSFLERTNSLPDLRDSPSVYNRLGYQSQNQSIYKNRINRTNNIASQRSNKAIKMQNALQISPTANNLPPLNRRQRRYSVGSLQSDAILRAQRRAQYEQKLMRINSRANIPTSYLDDTYTTKQRPSMDFYLSLQNQNSMMGSKQFQRGSSPFQQSLQSLKAMIPKTEPVKSQRQQQRRARSRSRSRARPVRRNSIMSLDDGDLEGRSFSEVMYSLSNNFGVTGRTLNDRFSLI